MPTQLTPRTVDEQRQRNLNFMLGKFANVANDTFQVEPDDEYNYIKKAEQLHFAAQRMRQQAAMQRMKNTEIATQNRYVKRENKNRTQRYPNSNFGDFLKAIAGKESGGNYYAVNKDSGALGKYQVMPSNISGQGTGWDTEALGRDISPQFFLNHPKIQEAIVRHKLREYYGKYGPAGAASAWYSGNPNAYLHSTQNEGAYPSVAAYVQDILKVLGLA